MKYERKLPATSNEPGMVVVETIVVVVVVVVVVGTTTFHKFCAISM